MNFEDFLKIALSKDPELRTLWRSSEKGARIQVMFRMGRAFLGLNQRQMARHIGIPRHHIKLAEETGKIRPRELALFLVGVGYQSHDSG